MPPVYGLKHATPRMKHLYMNTVLDFKAALAEAQREYSPVHCETCGDDITNRTQVTMDDGRVICYPCHKNGTPATLALEAQEEADRQAEIHNARYGY